MVRCCDSIAMMRFRGGSQIEGLSLRSSRPATRVAHASQKAALVLLHFATMTDMYEDPKAMEADGNLKPFPHEERGSEVCEI